MAKKENATRDELRGKLLGKSVKLLKKTFRYYPPILEEKEDGSVELVGHEEDPIIVEFRQPTIRTRNALINACRKEDNSIDELEFIIAVAIQMTFDPNSGEKLFTEADRPVLLEQPAGSGFVDQFSSEALSLINIGEDLGKQEQTDSVKT